MHDKKEEPLHNTVPKTLHCCSADKADSSIMLPLQVASCFSFTLGNGSNAAGPNLRLQDYLLCLCSINLHHITVKSSQLSNAHEMMQSTQYTKQIIHSSSFARLVVKGVVHRCCLFTLKTCTLSP